MPKCLAGPSLPPCQPSWTLKRFTADLNQDPLIPLCQYRLTQASPSPAEGLPLFDPCHACVVQVMQPEPDRKIFTLKHCRGRAESSSRNHIHEDCNHDHVLVPENEDET